MLASPTSRWSAGAVLLTVLIVAASWFLLISPKRSDAAGLRDQVSSAQDQATQLQTQIAQLKSDFADLPKKKAQLAAIKEQLPDNGDLPDLVRNLQSYAAAAGVTLTAITPGTPAIYSANGTTSTGSVATTVASGTVVQIPLSISVTGDYFEDALFTKSLQTKLTRALLITGVTTDVSQTGQTGQTSQTSQSSQALSGLSTGTTKALVTATPSATATASGGIALQLTSQIFVLVDDDTITLKQLSDQAKSATAKASSPAANASALATAQASAST